MENTLPSVTPISGVGDKGPACFLVETGSARLLLDLGVGPQPGRRPDLSSVGRVDAIVLSHQHPDHAGALDLRDRIGAPPIHASDLVCRALPAAVEARSFPLRGKTEIAGVTVTTGRSGHAPGGVWLHLAVGDGLLYMGDHCVESLLYAFDPPPPAGTIILDASYGDYDAPIARSFAALDQVVAAGGVLMPVPPAGRGPEIALYLKRQGMPALAFDDAMVGALDSLVGAGSACLQPGLSGEIAEVRAAARPLDGPKGVTLAAAANGASGAAARLLNEWEDRAEPQFVFTGYLPPGTPAERLVGSGRGRYLRWNIHPRLSDNAALATSVAARTVIPAFGHRRHLAAWQRAFAPARVSLEERVAL